jgi:hypothetical protein
MSFFSFKMTTLKILLFLTFLIGNTYTMLAQREGASDFEHLKSEEQEDKYLPVNFYSEVFSDHIIEFSFFIVILYCVIGYLYTKKKRGNQKTFFLSLRIPTVCMISIFFQKSQFLGFLYYMIDLESPINFKLFSTYLIGLFMLFGFIILFAFILFITNAIFSLSKNYSFVSGFYLLVSLTAILYDTYRDNLITSLIVAHLMILSLSITLILEDKTEFLGIKKQFEN